MKQTKLLQEQGKKDQLEIERLTKLMSENELQSKRELAAAMANVKKAVEDGASQAARDAEIIAQLKATMEERQLQMKKDQEERQRQAKADQDTIVDLQRRMIEGGYSCSLLLKYLYNLPYSPILSTHPLNSSYQHILSPHPINTPHQNTLSKPALTNRFSLTIIAVFYPPS